MQTEGADGIREALHRFLSALEANTKDGGFRLSTFFSRWPHLFGGAQSMLKSCSSRRFVQAFR